MELVTAPLRIAAIRNELPRIVEWFRVREVMDVDVMFGFGCEVGPDERWRLILVATLRLSDFIHDAESRGVFVFGRSDLFIYDSAIVVPTGEHTFEVRDDVNTTMFRFCHDSDIHLESNDEVFIEEVRRSWSDRGVRSYRTDDQRFVRGEHGPLPVNKPRFTLQDMRHWREIESQAGRPGGLADFYAAHDICCDCRGEGVSMIGWSKPIGADDLETAEVLQMEELPLYAVCAKCEGTGRAMRA